MAQYSTKSADPKVILDLKVNSREAIEAIISAREQIAALKEEQKQLEAEMRKGNGTKDMKERLVLIKTELRDLNTVMRANQRELDNNVKAYKQNGDSINAMRAQLKNLRQSYEDLSKADRESAVGEKLLADIDKLSTEIKGLEQAQGDFRSSVGSYGKLFDTTADQMQSFGSVLASIFGQNSIIGKAATVVTGFGKSISDMSKNITDMANNASASAKSVTDLGSSVTATTSAMNQVGDAASTASTVVQGFGAAERAAADAAKAMGTEAAASAAGTAATATASATAATATTSLAAGFKAAASGAAALAKQMLALLANPIVALIAATVAILMKLVSAFKANDEAMTELKAAFSAFQPILDFVNRLFEKLVGVATKAVTVLGKAAKAIAGFFGGESYKKAQEQAEALVRGMDALEDKEREYTEQHATNEAQISDLREKATDEENYTIDQRKKFLEQAADIERKDLATKKEIAQEKLDLTIQQALQEKGYTEMTAEAWAALSDDIKDHISDLRAAVTNTDKELSDFERRINREQSRLNNKAKSAGNANASNTKERIKNEREALRALEDLYIKSIKDMQTKEIAEARATSARRIEDLRDRLKTEKNLTAKARKAINDQIILLESDLQIQLLEIDEKYNEERTRKRLDEQKEFYSLMMQRAKGQVKEAYEIEIVKINNELLIQSLNQSVEAVSRAKDAIQKDIDTLTDDEIKIKYGADFDREQLNALLHEYEGKVLETQTYVSNMTQEIARQEQLAVTRITREGMNAREALAQEHATLLSEIETAKGLEAYYYNEVEKTRILQEQAQKRLEIAQQNLQTLEGYSKEEQIAIYGTQEAYQNALLQAQLDVVNGENAVAEAARNTTAAIAAQKDQMVETFKTISGSISSVLDSFQSIFDSLADSDEKYKKYSTALAMMNILVSTAVSIANAIQGATAAAAATGPGAPIATPIFIAEMVAIVAGAIASATATLKKAQSSAPAKPKFSTGGPVDRSVSGGMIGTKTTKRKDDTIDAKLSLGEYVIKSEIVKKYGIGFFDEINETRRRKPELPMRFAGGGTVPSLTTINQMTTAIDYSEMGEVFRDAVSDIQPVVSVQEINSMQTRVTVKEATASYN